MKKLNILQKTVDNVFSGMMTRGIYSDDRDMAIKKLPNTDWHIVYLRTGDDEKRDRRICVHYRDGKCEKKLLYECIGSSHCKLYKADEEKLAERESRKKTSIGEFDKVQFSELSFNKRRFIATFRSGIENAQVESKPVAIGFFSTETVLACLMWLAGHMNFLVKLENGKRGSLRLSFYGEAKPRPLDKTLAMARAVSRRIPGGAADLDADVPVLVSPGFPEEYATRLDSAMQPCTAEKKKAAPERKALPVPSSKSGPGFVLHHGTEKERRENLRQLDERRHAGRRRRREKRKQQKE